MVDPGVSSVQLLWDRDETRCLKRNCSGDSCCGQSDFSPATRFANLVYVANHTDGHPITVEFGRDVREQTRYATIYTTWFGSLMSRDL